MKLIWKYSIDINKRWFISSEEEFISDLEIIWGYWYFVPHLIDKDLNIVSYFAIVIKWWNAEKIEYNKETYWINPNRIYSNWEEDHFVFFLDKWILINDYKRIWYSLEFLYWWKQIDYHFYPKVNIFENYTNDETNKNFKKILNNLYFILNRDKNIEQELTIHNYKQYELSKKISIIDILILLKQDDDNIDIQNNIHLVYWNPYFYLYNYLTTKHKVFTFLNHNFKLDFKIEEEDKIIIENKTKEWVVIQEWNTFFMDENWYFSLTKEWEKKQLTDFFIKVYYKIIDSAWIHKFIITMTNCETLKETEKIIWFNATNVNWFADFIQKYWNYHYFGMSNFFVKELHKKITETKQVPIIKTVVWFWFQEEQNIIIFKNWLWDMQEKMFTEKVEWENYYFNFNLDWFYVVDKQWNDLSKLIEDWIPSLKPVITNIDEVYDFAQGLYTDDTWKYLIMLSLWMMWYLLYWELKQSFPIIFSRGCTWCVDYETEYLTPIWWKKISNYQKWDLIWEYDQETWICNFKQPLNYIKEKEEWDVYRIKTWNIDMILTKEHRVLYKSQRNKWYTEKLEDVILKLEKNNKANYSWINIPTVFDIEDNNEWLYLSNNDIRLMVAVIADWSFPNKSWARDKWYICYINIKKNRKKKRLRKLLNKSDIYFEELVSSPWYTRFRFEAPRIDKTFTEYYWKANKKQLKIISEEVVFWDWYKDKRNWSINFSTTVNESADFIQYAMLITNQRRVSKITWERIWKKYWDKLQYTRKSNDIVIRWTSWDKQNTRIQFKNISTEKMKDGYKYCFTTSTSYWIARRNWRIFITWNSWKSTFNNLLQKIWGVNRAWLDFSNSSVFTMTVMLSHLIKFPYFLWEYRESADQARAKTSILRSAFDKTWQTKGRADQTIIKYDYFSLPIIDWEEMILDWAVRTRSIQYQFSSRNKIIWNFHKTLREWEWLLDWLLYTYFNRSNWEKYKQYLDEWFEIFWKNTTETRIKDNMSLLYAGCMCFDPNKKYEYIDVFSKLINFQQDDFEKNSTSMQIIKAISMYLNSWYNPITVKHDCSWFVIPWNSLEEYINKNKVELTLKLSSYKEHLEVMWMPLWYHDTWVNMIDWVLITINKDIHKQFLVNPEVYAWYKRYLNNNK